jgi:hypothetical protein
LADLNNYKLGKTKGGMELMNRAVTINLFLNEASAARIEHGVKK